MKNSGAAAEKRWAAAPPDSAAVGAGVDGALLTMDVLI